jgi:hypothetical protein
MVGLRGLRGMGQSGSDAGSSGASSAGSSAVPVGAIISAGVSLVTTAINLILNSGCGPTCVETSEWANAAEGLLKQNIAAYFSLPAPRSAADQAQAIANFESIWAGLVSRCSQSGTGTAGAACIADRQAGACKWNQTADSPLLAYTSEGEPDVGACWNWWNGYLYPIQNDPDVSGGTTESAGQLELNEVSAASGAGTQASTTASTTTASTSTTAASTSSGSISTGTLYLIGAALLAIFAFMGKK